MPGRPLPDPAPVAIEVFGDAALLVTLGDRVDPSLAARAQRLAASLDGIRSGPGGFGRAVPAHASVLIPFDPLAIELDEAVAVVRRLIDMAAVPDGDPGPLPPDGTRATRGAAIEIPIRYGGADGPDLDAVAELHGLSPADVMDAHAGATYHVLFLGFAPGFAYLGGLPEALATPRRPSPRERVPAGSVGIAGRQSAVYPLAMPGGWQLIGRTDARLFDPSRMEPALLRPGATVRFVPVQ